MRNSTKSWIGLPIFLVLWLGGTASFILFLFLTSFNIWTPFLWIMAYIGILLIVTELCSKHGIHMITEI